MGVLLGDEWVRPESDPLEVPGFAEQELVQAQLDEAEHKAHLEALLAQIAQGVSALERQEPPAAPVVSTSPPMTVDTTGLATAFTQALAALPRTPDTTAELTQLAKVLDRLDRRVSAGALSGGSGGGVSNSILEQIRDRIGFANNTDLNNSAAIPNWAANAVYDGAWTEVDQAGSLFAFYLTYQLTAVPAPVVQWSSDGINVDTFAGSPTTTAINQQTLVSAGITYYLGYLTVNPPLIRGKYYRLHAVNGGATSAFFYAIAGVGNQSAVGSVGPITDPLSQLSVAQLTRSVLAGALPDGTFQNVALTPLRSLRSAIEGSPAVTSGSLFTESVRDDISISFSRDSYTASTAKIVAVATQVGTISQNGTDGRIVFATGAGTGRVCYFESVSAAIYEPGHEIIGEQTLVVPALTGTADVRWGYMEDNGAGAIMNGMGWGLDATGLYVWRTKNSADAIKVRQSAFNRDKLDGSTNSLFRRAGVPVAFSATMNTLYRIGYEWLGISPPLFRIQSPERPIIDAHTDETSNSQTGTTIPEPSLPLAVRVFSGDMAGGVSVESGSWRGGIHTSKIIVQGALAADTGQQDVTTVATALSTTFANRTSIRLKNMVGSARALQFGFTGALTSLNGDELDAGESIDLDLDDGVSVYVITTSTGGAGVRASWTELA